MDFGKKDGIYKQAKVGLVKYIRDESSKTNNSAAIKLDTVLTTQDEEILLTRGWQKPNRTKGPFKNISGAPKKKPINPPGPDGKPLICPSCGCQFKQRISRLYSFRLWLHFKRDGKILVGEL